MYKIGKKSENSENFNTFSILLRFNRAAAAAAMLAPQSLAPRVNRQVQHRLQGNLGGGNLSFDGNSVAIVVAVLVIKQAIKCRMPKVIAI